ncbi:flagellar radial spoke protein 5 isoform X1 [Prunus yedoensis var. nudiflora]|uniref:Flagellar radial spoke protein 5 isoform X1 n=1 Tax=Prunus yedoensis var. nudiflora TaxID=2094558 RepID=A0A314YNM9_PRUYE|nr:flagellar radial spoke protein 5 isoform X1 [Prunus yedoensis var. nudiflora]
MATLHLHSVLPNPTSFKSTKATTSTRRRLLANSVRCAEATQVTGETQRVTVRNGNDSLDIGRVLNGMWQTSGGWGRIDRDDAVEAMLRYADAGLSTFDMADHYGPAEDLYGIFINRVRQERPPEFLEKVRGLTKWVPPPVKMTSSYVRDSINVSRKRMDVASLDMLQFHWWDYANTGYLDALKHLTDLKEEGKIKTVALTNFDTERLQIILENEIPVVSNQVQHSIVDMRPQQKMAELCQLTGVKLITWSMPGEDGVSFNLCFRHSQGIASKHGATIPNVAVKYILDQQAVAGSMIGVRLGLSEHIQDSNAVFSLTLDEDDISSIQEVTKKGKNLLKVIGDCGDEYRRA